MDYRSCGGDEMKTAVLQFPGTNCEFETLVAVKAVGMDGELFRWNRSAGELSGFDGFVIPGGFSYQDRIRAGAIAAKEPVMSALKEEAEKGKPIIGICNGFQILVEAGLLPGEVKDAAKGNAIDSSLGNGKKSSHVDMALAQNVMISQGKIVRRGYYCDWVNLRHEAPSRRCCATFAIERGALLKIPIAHGEGNLGYVPVKVALHIEDGEAISTRERLRNRLGFGNVVDVKKATIWKLYFKTLKPEAEIKAREIAEELLINPHKDNYEILKN
jgi:phosphoribosylformylglycinamidine synthase subunit PurQ / glutaminase